MTSPPANGFSREELLRRRSELLGLSKGRIALILVGGIAGLAATLWCKHLVEQAEDVGRLVTLALTGLFVPVLAIVVLLIFAARDIRRKRVLCPRCGEQVLFDLTLATHRCGWCGEQIVSGPLPPGPAAEDAALLPTRAEFAQDVRLANRVVSLAVGLGLAAMIPGIIILMAVGNWYDVHRAGQVPAAVSWILILVMAGFPAVSLVLGFRQAAHRYHLHCPRCKGSLLVERRANLAATTGRCPACGAAVLRDAPSALSATLDVQTVC